MRTRTKLHKTAMIVMRRRIPQKSPKALSPPSALPRPLALYQTRRRNKQLKPKLGFEQRRQLAARSAVGGFRGERVIGFTIGRARRELVQRRAPSRVVLRRARAQWRASITGAVAFGSAAKERRDTQGRGGERWSDAAAAGCRVERTRSQRRSRPAAARSTRDSPGAGWLCSVRAG